jgi:hypothetical protein
LAHLLQAMAQQTLAVQQALAESMLSTCLKRCVSDPNAKLSDKQRRCLDACSTSFFEGFDLAAATFSTIASKSGGAANE